MERSHSSSYACIGSTTQQRSYVRSDLRIAATVQNGPISESSPSSAPFSTTACLWIFIISTLLPDNGQKSKIILLKELQFIKT